MLNSGRDITMKKHIQTFLGGTLIIVPFAITGYFVWWLANKLGALGSSLLDGTGLVIILDKFFPKGWVGNWQGNKYVSDGALPYIFGAILVLVAIYFVGMLARLYIFRKIVGTVERWVTHVPGVKTIYESVRDLMKLFGGDSAKMGRAVLYKIPQTEITVMGILTNERPSGLSVNGEQKVAVYLPFSYMFGGPTIYVSPEDIIDTGMTVDQALKLCATAHVGSTSDEALEEVGINEGPPETKI